MTDNKGDLISREALKNDLITFFPNKCLEGITTKTLFNQILTDINNAPTVEPQNKWGKWVISEIRCPNCLEYFDTGCYSKGELNKCPSCGTKLKGGAE